MPIEFSLLQHEPEPLSVCPNCRLPFESFLRGQVQSWWRKLLHMKYCAVICRECKEIVGHEKP